MGFAFIALLLLSGCATSGLRGVNVPALDAYAARAEQDLAVDPGPVTTMAERNTILETYLNAVDIQYNSFVDSWYGSQATAETVTDLLIVALASSSALAGGELAKTILAAGAAALGAGKGVVSADLWGGQDKIPLRATLESLRIEKRRQIAESERMPVRSYSLAAGMGDVLAYAHIGLADAIQVLTKRATEGLAVAEDRLEAVKRLPPVAEE